MGSNYKPVVLVSGGFDPIHEGHIAYLEDAARFGSVVVALNSDEWLIRKKGYCFMPFESRKRILEAIKFVDKVIEVNDYDGTVCDALRSVKPDIFANGGDRTYGDASENAYCLIHKINQFFGVGGVRKLNSSSKLVENIR